MIPCATDLLPLSSAADGGPRRHSLVGQPAVIFFLFLGHLQMRCPSQTLPAPSLRVGAAPSLFFCYVVPPSPLSEKALRKYKLLVESVLPFSQPSGVIFPLSAALSRGFTHFPVVRSRGASSSSLSERADFLLIRFLSAHGDLSRVTRDLHRLLTSAPPSSPAPRRSYSRAT